MRVLLLNAPPRSGKNTAADIVQRISDNADVLGFSWHLKRMVHGAYLGRRGWDMHPDHFDDCKSLAQHMLAGRSWRQEYIRFSEQVMKPLHGDEWFGDRFMEAAHETGAELIAVPDSGFRREAERVVREVGAQNVRLARLRRDGCTFAGDSRSYIDLSDLGVWCYDVENNGSLADLEAEMRDVMRGWGP